MKRKKMPTTRVLDITAAAVLVAGIALCGYVLFFKFTGVNSAIISIIILLMSVVLAGLIRMAGIMAEFLYTSTESLSKATESLSKATESLFVLKQSVVSLSDDILRQELPGIKHNIERISSDTKDITVSIDDINVFFQKIERHLDLKK